MAVDKTFNDAAWKTIPEFVVAAAKGELEALGKQLHDGMKIDAQDINGTTALIAATREGKVEAVNFLLQNNADVSVRNREGWTALDMAARTGNALLVETLLKAGANAASANDCDACFMTQNGKPWKTGLNLGVTTLMVACENGFTQIAETLIANKADVKAVDKWGRSALMRVAENGHVGTVYMLLTAGADPDGQDKAGWSVLRTAAWHGHKDVVAALIEKVDPTKAATPEDSAWAALRNPKSPCPAMDDALVCAAAHGNGEIARMLLDRGADVNARQNSSGASALYLAAQFGNADIVRILLDRGADKTIANFRGALPGGGASQAIKDMIDPPANEGPRAEKAPAPQPPKP